MHEWALADAVVSMIEEKLGERNLSILKGVHVRLGELQNIDREIFVTGLKMMLRGKHCSLEVFKIDMEEAGFKCNYCGTEWKLNEYPGIGEDEREAIHFLPESAHAYMKCPKCSSSDFTVSAGRGVLIESIELNGQELTYSD